MIKYLYHLPFLSTFDPETLEAESRLNHFISFNKYESRISRNFRKLTRGRITSHRRAPEGSVEDEVGKECL